MTPAYFYSISMFRGELVMACCVVSFQNRVDFAVQLTFVIGCRLVGCLGF